VYTERSRWTDRTVTLERPLFPGYVFVDLTSHNRLAIVSTPGVIRVLGNSINGIVSSDEIARIRSGIEEGCVLRPHSNVRLGTHVRVRHGVFAGAEGIVAELRQRCKVVISFAAVNQSFSLEENSSNLEIIRIIAPNLGHTTAGSTLIPRTSSRPATV
jgi:transcriptional antiterminator RfaH